MQIIKAGIEYRLYNFGSTTDFQEVIFTEKHLGGYNPGTTNEEVVNMLVDRFYELQKRRFSVENQCIIILLRNVRELMKRRLEKKLEKTEKHGKVIG
ncbi:MAG TPA: hypothetical protein DCL77_09110 [Prolixibacteraceae bacterium]|jgi:hypothetical protein|nr:hypothetical protein [Prolixibacteraceae bacterium]